MVYNTESGHFVVVRGKDALVNNYDNIIYCLRQVLRKHRAELANSVLAMTQVEVFATTPQGLVLLHFDKQGFMDGFATALAVGGDAPWVEVIHLWLYPGSVKNGLANEGLDFIQKYAWENWGISRLLVSITRSPKKLFKFFYEPLGFRPVGLILERDCKNESDSTTIAGRE